MSEVQHITFNDFERLFEASKHEHLKAGEPLPEMSEANKAKIIGVLDYPFQEVFGTELYKTIEEKAACLLYGFLKGHYLINGNKRLGILTTDFFLRKNKYDYSISTDALEKLIYSVVQSNPNDKQQQIQEIVSILKNEPEPLRDVIA